MENFKNFKNLEIVFFGTPSFVIPIIEALNSHFELKAIITAPTLSDAASYGEKQQIPVLKPEILNEEFIQQNKKVLDADLYIVASYGKLIPQSLLNIPQYGSLNIHPSKLPKFRGPSPIQNTILSGDLKTAITIIQMDEELDHGPIVYQEDFPLTKQDTFASLLESMFKKSADTLIKVIPEFVSGKIAPLIQDHTQATFTDHITKENGYFDINNPPQNLEKMIRAYYPWPTAWTKWNGKIVKFLPEGKIQMEGKKPIPFKEFLNGYTSFPKEIIKSFYS